MFFYDTRSNLVRRVDARGVQTHYNFNDPLNRLLSVVYDKSGAPGNLSANIPDAPNVSYSYMTSGDKMRAASVAVSNGMGNEQLSYDSEGRLSQVYQTFAGREGYPIVTNYIWDTLDRLKEGTYPQQYNAGEIRKKVEPAYDIASRIDSLKFGGVTMASNPVYNAASQTTSLDVGSQIKELYGYDPKTGLMTDQQVKRGADILVDLKYNYTLNNDANNNGAKTGQLTGITDLKNTARNRAYEYDKLGRLVKVKGGANAFMNPTWYQTYSYDRYGNRTLVQRTDIGMAPVSPGLQSRSDLIGKMGQGAGGAANRIFSAADPFAAPGINEGYGSINAGFSDGDNAGTRARGGPRVTTEEYDAASPANGFGRESLAEHPASAQPAATRKEYGYRGALSRPPVAAQSGEIVWVDDALPAGAVAAADWGDGWNWVSSSPAPISGSVSHISNDANWSNWSPPPYSGNMSHQSNTSSGVHQHYYFSSQVPIPVTSGGTLYAYIYIDPENIPQEVMLQWGTYTDGWEHRAYWGANIIGWGTDGTASRRYMGSLPQAGGWVRLEVPASAVGLEGLDVGAMAFTLYGGRANWDLAGTEGVYIHYEERCDFDGLNWYCYQVPVEEYLNSVFVDDSIPLGAASGADGGDSWNWRGANNVDLLHQHYFYNASNTLQVGAGDRLFTWVYLDPASTPSEVMLQWNENGSWEHRAYWGANRIGWGVDGTQSRRYMGSAPPAGQWVRLEVEASAVGLEGKTLNGMAFTLYGGRASWDKAGKIDTAAPVLSNIAAGGITSSGATIIWNTNENSDSQVEYGSTTAYGQSTALNPALVTAHSQGLSGLAPGTVYHYRVKSRDAAGNLAVSGDFTFTTSADTTAPVISNIAAGNITATSATITWNTNENSDSQVEYGLDTGYGLSAPVTPNPALVTAHSQVLSGLTAGTVYHYRVKSRDAGGNLAVSGDFTFTTASSGSVPLDGLPSLSYNAANNRINTPGFEYDPAGNQTRAVIDASGTQQQYRYDCAGRLAQSLDASGNVLATYAYGAGNQRLVSVEGGVTKYYAWDGGQIIAEYEAWGTNGLIWKTSYVYLGGRLLATTSGADGNETRFHHPDRLGTRLVTDATGAVVSEQLSMPFGTMLPFTQNYGGENSYQNPTLGNPSKKRFTSYDRSDATGLDYAVNRFYSPQQGRFTQADPIGMGAASLGNPQTLNMYAYCGNDPINHVDPAGTSFFGKLFRWIGKIFKWIAIVAVVAIAVLTVVPGAWAGTVLAKIGIWAAHHSILASLLGLHSPQWAIIHLASREGAAAAGFWAMAGVGAVHDFLAQQKEQKKEEKKLDTKLFISRYFRAFGKKLNECINKVFKNPQIPKIDESNAPDVNFSKDSYELGKMVDWSGQKKTPPEPRQAFATSAPNEGKKWNCLYC